eukprot:7904985-Alexandrium_andersonii.AAC.1
MQHCVERFSTLLLRAARERVKSGRSPYATARPMVLAGPSPGRKTACQERAIARGNSPSTNSRCSFSGPHGSAPRAGDRQMQQRVK